MCKIVSDVTNLSKVSGCQISDVTCHMYITDVTCQPTKTFCNIDVAKIFPLFKGVKLFVQANLKFSKIKKFKKMHKTLNQVYISQVDKAHWGLWYFGKLLPVRFVSFSFVALIVNFFRYGSLFQG